MYVPRAIRDLPDGNPLWFGEVFGHSVARCPIVAGNGAAIGTTFGAERLGVGPLGVVRHPCVGNRHPAVSAGGQIKNPILRFDHFSMLADDGEL